MPSVLSTKPLNLNPRCYDLELHLALIPPRSLARVAVYPREICAWRTQVEFLSEYCLIQIIGDRLPAYKRWQSQVIVHLHGYRTYQLFLTLVLTTAIQPVLFQLQYI